MKKLRICTLVLLFGLFLSTSVIHAQISFDHGKVSEVLSRAAVEDKIIFVDAFTDWCGPCKWMAANTFTDKEVADFFNVNFINYKLDMEKGEGPDFAKKYNVQAYPTLLFINADGKLIEKKVGALDAKEFLKAGKQVHEGIEAIADMDARFASGEYDAAFLRKYVLRLEEAYANNSEAIEKLAPYMEGEKLLEKENFDVFSKCNFGTDSEPFKYFRDNFSAFVSKYGEDAENLIRRVYYSEMYGCIKGNDPERWDLLAEEFRAAAPEIAARTIAKLELTRYQIAKDWKNFEKAAITYYSDDREYSWGELNQIAWAFYEHVDDEEGLENAINWIEKSVSIEENFYNLDTYAMLLWKVGKVDEAKKTAQKAIDMGKKLGEDTSGTEEALKKMK